MFVDSGTDGFSSDIRRMSNGKTIEAAKDVVDSLSLGKTCNTDIKSTILLTYENNTIYVILKKGFSNFIKFNNKGLEKDLINEIINFAFKYFKPTDIYDGRHFKKFLILNKTK